MTEWAWVTLALALVAAYLVEIRYSISARLITRKPSPIVVAVIAFLITVAALIVLSK